MIFIVLPLSLADYWANWNKKVVEPATLLFCPPSGGMAAHLNFPLIRGLFPGNTKGGQFLGKSPWVTLPPSAEKGGKPRLHLIRGKSALKKSGRRRRRRRRTNPSPSPLSQEHKGRGGGGGLLSTLFSYYEKELASKWGISLCAHAKKTKWCFAFSLFLRLSGVIFFGEFPTLQSRTYLGLFSLSLLSHSFPFFECLLRRILLLLLLLLLFFFPVTIFSGKLGVVAVRITNTLLYVWNSHADKKVYF